MLPINRLSVSQPQLLEPGAVIVSAQYERDPMLLCGGEENLGLLNFGEFGEARLRFTIRAMAVNLGPHIVFENVSFEVDPTSTISPTRSDIPYGALVLEKDVWMIKARMGYASAYVDVKGPLREMPGYDESASFGRWKMVLREGDEVVTLFEQDCMPEGT